MAIAEFRGANYVFQPRGIRLKLSQGEDNSSIAQWLESDQSFCGY